MTDEPIIPMPMPSETVPPLPGVVADPAAPAMPKGPSFAELGLHADVMRAVDEMGFSEPMPVQARTFPLIMQGRDLMVQSRTGSGKTAAFGIPFANSIVVPEDKFVQAVILLPTRELALQVASELARICAFRDITVVPVYGGAPMGKQVEQLRAGGQIVCGTPGRVLDHLRRGTLRLDKVRSAVLDECDEMLSMGFQEDIETILERTPVERQTLLFSATVPEGIQRLARRFLRNPEMLKLSGDYVSVHEIRHVYYSIPGIHREMELLRILDFEDPKSAIIFCNTREETGRVAEFLRQKGHDAEAISSDLSQTDRERVLGRMRAGGIKFLVATDVAARGIDIENLSHVFNYTFPEAPEIYIHRTGRTGRAGRQGTAISLIGPTEVGSFYYLKLAYKIKPEERALPSESEIRSHREGERILELRRALEGDPGGEWRALARRLIGAVDGERLVAALLAGSFSKLENMPPLPVIKPPPPAPVPFPSSSSSVPSSEPPRDRDRDRPRFGDRDRPRFGDRDRPRERGRPGDRDRPRFGDRPRGGGGPESRGSESRGPESRGPESRGPESRGAESRAPEARGPEGRASEDRPIRRQHDPRRPRPLRTDEPPQEREFWEVWSEEKEKARAQQAESGAGSAPAVVGGDDLIAPLAPVSPFDGGHAPAGDAPPPRTDVARLYLNLGRKDGASDRDIRELLTAHAGEASVADIEVMNTHTYLNVAPTDAERIATALTGKELGGRQLVCEAAKPRRR